MNKMRVIWVKLTKFNLVFIHFVQLWGYTVMELQNSFWSQLLCDLSVIWVNDILLMPQIRQDQNQQPSSNPQPLTLNPRPPRKRNTNVSSPTPLYTPDVFALQPNINTRSRVINNNHLNNHRIISPSSPPTSKHFLHQSIVPN